MKFIYDEKILCLERIHDRGLDHLSIFNHHIRMAGGCGILNCGNENIIAIYDAFLNVLMFGSIISTCRSFIGALIVLPRCQGSSFG